MSDQLDQESVDAIRQAMRDLTDTFHRSPVTLRQANGAEVDLLAGLKPDDTGTYGEVHGETYVQEDRSETVERWIVSFNRDYLQEKGLIDPAEEPARQLLITKEDRLVINGRRFSITKLFDRGIFRGVPILVLLTVVR